MTLNFRSALLALIFSPTLSACVTPLTPETFNAKPASISAEKSPIPGTQGFDFIRKGSGFGGIWQMGEYFGRWRGSTESFSVFNARRVAFPKTKFTLNGPGFDTELSAECSGRALNSRWFWYPFEPNDLAYGCRFDDGVTEFEVALANSQSLLGALLNERAGTIIHDGVELRLMSADMDIPGYSSWTDREGYVFVKDDTVIGGLDYRVLKPAGFIPPLSNPVHKTAIIAAVSLALFDDPEP